MLLGVSFTMRWKCGDGSREWFRLHVLYSRLTCVWSKAVSWGKMSDLSRCEAFRPVAFGQLASGFSRNSVGRSWVLVVHPEERGNVTFRMTLFHRMLGEAL